MPVDHLPDRLLITPDPSTEDGVAPFLARLERALSMSADIGLVQLRARQMTPEAWIGLAHEALKICHAHGARMIANGPSTSDDVEADGIHLGSKRLMSEAAIDAINHARQGGQLVSAACHDLAQIARAEQLRIDLITLSPVLPTQTHPGAAPLGWPRFGEWVARTALPVYALGGMRIEHIAMARAAGAQGIAAIRGLW